MRSLTTVLLVLFLLGGAESATAFGFCFSFGSKTHSRPYYNAYRAPYPGMVAPGYPVYGYNPVSPPYNQGNIFYPQPLPGVMAQPESISK